MHMRAVQTMLPSYTNSPISQNSTFAVYHYQGLSKYISAFKDERIYKNAISCTYYEET